MTKKSKLVLAMASMLGITAGATAVSGFAWFTTTKGADLDITNIGVYSKSSGLDVRLKAGAPLEGCVDSSTDPSDEGDINLVGASATSTTVDSFDGDDSTVTFTLSKYPNAKPVVAIDGVTYDASKVNLGTTGVNQKKVTLDDPVASGSVVTFTYTAYAALTDTSSVDGQKIYKPVWTASGEGQYATSIPEASEGYIKFEMTLTATGASPLQVFLDRPSIDPVDTTANSADDAAAKITRVAFIEDKTTDETLLVLQKNPASPNNKGIDASFAAAPTYDSDDEGTDPDLYDLSALTATVSETIFKAPDTATNKSTLPGSWGNTVGNQTKANNFLTTIPAGQSKDIIVAIWLEGTSYNDGNTAYGKYAALTNPENGMISVHLPLIAF